MDYILHTSAGIDGLVTFDFDTSRNENPYNKTLLMRYIMSYVLLHLHFQYEQGCSPGCLKCGGGGAFDSVSADLSAKGVNNSGWCLVACQPPEIFFSLTVGNAISPQLPISGNNISEKDGVNM